MMIVTAESLEKKGFELIGLNRIGLEIYARSNEEENSITYHVMGKDGESLGPRFLEKDLLKLLCSNGYVK